MYIYASYDPQELSRVLNDINNIIYNFNVEYCGYPLVNEPLSVAVSLILV